MNDIRGSYDTVAAEYHAILRDNLEENPYDRAALDLFAELVPAGPVGDLGCGPGRITTYLASLGLDAFGIDLSPEMVAGAVPSPGGTSSTLWGPRTSGQMSAVPMWCPGFR